MKSVVSLAVGMAVFVILGIGNGSLWAQPSDIYTRLAEADSLKGSRIEIFEEETLQGIATKNITPDRDIRGYRVRIFFDNGQTARQTANEVKTQFEEMFPTVDCYLDYENPYFKVTVGNCLSAEEAVMLWDKVKRVFDRAFVIRENISIDEITKEKEKKTDTQLTQISIQL